MIWCHSKKKSRRSAFTRIAKNLFLVIRCQSSSCLVNVREFDDIEVKEVNNLSNRYRAFCS
jgi:hypothetical protein